MGTTPLSFCVINSLLVSTFLQGMRLTLTTNHKCIGRFEGVILTYSMFAFVKFLVVSITGMNLVSMGWAFQGLKLVAAAEPTDYNDPYDKDMDSCSYYS
jgi:hypothetical protein